MGLRLEIFGSVMAHANAQPLFNGYLSLAIWPKATRVKVGIS
ncbi:hypothetical protein KPSA1_02872 [Pseudomonas syringae pv. actinidiae]|uniref:Uncharacterized protein n=1 Tax=Pseudomonas syringae pv. actinidiae TaxID=103796 RepID=A0A2V0Q947_PSESF|nr:hypothetical protein KPSA1_02872 [Pseudomonas syringae pv. actinidiae]